MRFKYLTDPHNRGDTTSHQLENSMERQRVSEIENLVAQNKLTAAEVFVQKKQLVYREEPYHAFCKKMAYEVEIRKLKRLIKEESDYLDTNELTQISNSSILHKKFQETIY